MGSFQSEKSLTEIVNKAGEWYPKLFEFREEGRPFEAYTKAAEMYHKLASFPEEEIKQDIDAMNTIASYLYFLSMIAYDLGKYSDCMSWGLKFTDFLGKIFRWTGVEEEEVE